MQKKSEKIIFTLYLLGFLALALTLALLQPLANTPPLYGNPPDEHARYLIPQFICKYGKIPTGWEEEVRIPAYGFSYALYNVFPYIVQGYLMRFVSLFTESEVVLLYTARLVNVTFGLLMAVVVYLIGKRMFRDDRFRWLFCFAVTYLPEGLFLHTYVNTDSCCMLSTAMMVYALVCVYQDGINLRNSLWMSGGIILCALSYYNAYGYIVSCILLFLLSFLQKKKNGGYFYDWKNMLKYGCLIAGVVLAGIGWWFIRSYIVLDGDLLGLATREKMAIQYAVESVNPLTMQTYQSMGYTVLEMFRERYTLSGLFHSFVAAFGSMSIYGSIWLYRAYKADDKPSDEILSLINYYACLQFTEEVRQYVAYSMLEQTETDRLQQIITNAEAGIPTLVGYFGSVSNTEERYGHAVVAYDVEYGPCQFRTVDPGGIFRSYVVHGIRTSHGEKGRQHVHAGGQRRDDRLHLFCHYGTGGDFCGGRGYCESPQLVARKLFRNDLGQCESDEYRGGSDFPYGDPVSKAAGSLPAG